MATTTAAVSLPYSADTSENTFSNFMTSSKGKIIHQAMHNVNNDAGTVSTVPE
jgi:hypothetical protein